MRMDLQSLGTLRSCFGSCGRELVGLDLVIMPVVGQRHGVARARVCFACLCWLACLLGPLDLPLRGAEVEEAREQFIHGHYTNCIQICEQAIADQEYGEEWRLLLIQALRTVGRYTNALTVLTNNLERYPSSLRLRLAGRQVLLDNDQKEQADALLQEISFLVRSRAWAYRSAVDMVAMGQAALLMGVDPREVLNQLFDRAKKADPACREVYLATGQVALDKSDFALAAKTFSEGVKKFPKDPDLQFGLAQAYADSNRRQMVHALETALDENTNHVPSFLLLADHMIDGEEYTNAEQMLEKVLAVNPWQPEAWAYRAVIGHLRGDAAGEAEGRGNALRYFKSNPGVDFLIGKKLSQKYRFAEGAAAQRVALKLDANYLPAKIQLAQDLLRLGEEREGWALADQVHQADGYDITAYNLDNLHDSLAKFQTLTNADFILRMSRREAAIYGPEALELLHRAKAKLSVKYGLELAKPTIVEVFPEQKDFGVRTFGMPGNPGYLGVCFGNVITANSPASQGHPANWQAVLFHEFCHVITLNLTHNKMPRWLSEGISVYEEREEDPTWGQVMNPRYREMVLGEDLTPVGELSAAFLAPKTDLHLQFAYFESALVVEFLVKEFGADSLVEILRDLGAGFEINEAIASHTEPMENIESDFADFAHERAESLAPGLDWEKPDGALRPDDEWVSQHPTNYYALHRQARKLLAEKKFEEAKVPLDKLIQGYRGDISADNAYKLLAAAHRNLGETNLEREVLSRLAALDADDLDAFSRLMELSNRAGDWAAVAESARRFLAVNPLMAEPYRYRARACEALEQKQQAIQAYQTLLLLDPADPAEAHYRLARLLYDTGDSGAKRHVLQALEEAPRFRDAQRLLLKISRDTGPKSEPPAAPRPE